MTETKVYKLHESKQVEDITTLLKIEGIKHKVFEYEEYTAIEVTGTPLEIIRASTIYQQVATIKLCFVMLYIFIPTLIIQIVKMIKYRKAK